ncbi:hypothetical protein [Pseudoalteromonas sp. R3]|uniref:hypothetical protein n=1 Tax=Pseudoalteromonas sp. R3 TaxID=1709477 RepID=UPI000AF6AFE7|nr:hypothetical protein [Pseudoalteromonas sp. R3]AZZ98873.1 hypothetical protein ELR70_18265 [Pseudoalteromonas sp. R3]
MKKWQLLFGFAAFVTVSELIGLPFKENVDLSNFVSLIVSGILLIPLYGYAFNVAIGSKAIAIAIFVFTAVVPGGFTLIFGVAFTIQHFSVVQLVFSTGSFALLLFMLYPVFMYAFKSDELWLKNTK